MPLIKLIILKIVNQMNRLNHVGKKIDDDPKGTPVCVETQGLQILKAYGVKFDQKINQKRI